MDLKQETNNRKLKKITNIYFFLKYIISEDRYNVYFFNLFFPRTIKSDFSIKYFCGVQPKEN